MVVQKHPNGFIIGDKATGKAMWQKKMLMEKSMKSMQLQRGAAAKAAIAGPAVLLACEALAGLALTE
eukprot:7841031-Lingulodinium_polyedra.AAC.1